MRRLLTTTLIVICALMGISFATLNADPVAIDYYLGVRAVPLSLIVVATLILGVLIGALATLGWVMGARREIGRLKKAGRNSDVELNALRTLPVKGV